MLKIQNASYKDNNFVFNFLIVMTFSVTIWNISSKVFNWLPNTTIIALNNLAVGNYAIRRDLYFI